ncbi:MAG: hypothetical protein ACK4YP_03315 [Myxococcota bacterium]
MSGRPALLGASSLVVLALALIGAQACTGGAAEPLTCVPTSEAATAAPVEAPEVALFWDDSGSMKRFYGKDGPYARIGNAMEATILPAANLFRFRHSYVAETLVEAANYHAPAFDGNATDLLAVAERMAGVGSPDAPGVAVLLSDLLVVTPPAQRAVANASACGVPLPQEPRAPYHFAVCLENAMKAYPAQDLYASVVRLPHGAHAMYALVMGRAPDAAKAVVREIRNVSQGSTELVLLDTTLRVGTASVGACSWSGEDPVYMGSRVPGKVDACRFRYRGEPAGQALTCTLAASPQGALIQLVPDRVLGGTSSAPVGEDGAYTVALPPTKGALRLTVGNRFAAPTDAERDAAIDAFVHPPTEPPTELSEDERHVKDVLRGLVRALAVRPAPDGAAWSVRYE